MKFSTPWYLTAVFAAASMEALCAQGVQVRLENDFLRVSATKFQFLTGKPLERLHDGASVIFVMQLALLSDPKSTIERRTAARFAVSYDLWEEKFAVTRLGGSRRSASHLSANATQAWCLDELSLPASGLSADAPFWLRLEVRAEDDTDESASDDDSRFTLARLVELFSRPATKEQPRWREEMGPVRLRDLR